MMKTNLIFDLHHPIFIVIPSEKNKNKNMNVVFTYAVAAKPYGL